jgi:hypothetical protein
MIAAMSMALAGIRGRALLVAGVLALFLATGIALTSAHGDAALREDPTERLLLRLHDLPPGFINFLGLGSDSDGEFLCEPLQPAEPPRKVASFIDRFSPAGCVGLYLRAYPAPGAESPSLAGTGALDTGSAAAVAAGYAVAPQLLGILTKEGSKKLPAPEIVGEATQLFHWRDVPSLFEEEDQRGSFVVWRSGNVVAAAFATTASFGASDRIAFDLARRQQAHIENPTPYTAAERYDTEVFLDSPNLDFPVYWLGRTFNPGHGLRPARLVSAYVPLRPDGRPKAKSVNLDYSQNVSLESLDAAHWNPAANALPRWTWRCSESSELELPQGGHAVIYASYEKNLRRCPKRPPRQYSALVHIGGMAIVVDREICPPCLGNTIARGEYNSLKGMKAIVRGLQLRPKPVYPAARR